MLLLSACGALLKLLLCLRSADSEDSTARLDYRTMLLAGRFLPIIIVDDWNDVNSNYLKNKYNKIINDHFNFSPLFLKYWQKKIDYNETNYDLKPMTLDQFKTFLSN